jgi:hypothetical protein
MTLLLLGAGAEPNVRSLFANFEVGGYWDAGDRYGASETKRAWRRNLLTYSEMFSDASWIKSATTVSINTATNPVDGTTTADTLIETAASSAHNMQRTTTLEQGLVYTYSIHAKTNGRQLQFVIPSAVVSSGFANFDLTNGVPGSVSAGVSQAMTSMGDGWYRCAITFTAAAGGSQTFNIALVQTAASFRGESYLGDGASGIFVVGAQFEQAATASTYQKVTDWISEFNLAYPQHSLFQDTLAQTPAVYPGDPIGLQLDTKAGGLALLGSEINPNTTFDNDTGWTTTEGASPPTISGGTINWSGSTGGRTSSASLVVGRWYLLEYDIVSYTSGSIALRDGTTNFTLATAGVPVGRQRRLINATGTQIRIVSFSSATAVLDNISIKEVVGTHRYQGTSGSRPLLARTPEGGRRNQLTYSDNFENAAWVKTGGVTVTTNAVANPLDGTVNADLITMPGSAMTAIAYQSSTHSAATLSFYFKVNTGVQFIQLYTTAAAGFANFDIVNGVAGTTGAGTTSVITSEGNGWFRCSMSNVGGTIVYFNLVTSNSAARAVSSTVSGSFYFYGAQLEPGALSNYQRVTVDQDCTERGKRDCWGVWYNGLDRSFITNTVDFPAATTTTRRNLIRGSENFGFPWSIGVAAATYNEPGPEGRNNATTFTTTVGGAGQTHVHASIFYTPSQPYVLTFWLKGGTALGGNIGLYANAAFLSQTGSTLSGPGTITGAGLQTIGNLSTSVWTKYQILFTAPASGQLDLYFYGETSGVKTGLSQSVAQFQLEPGSTPTDYQPTGTDKMTVISAARKFSDAAVGIVAELTADTGANNGSFYLLAGPPSGTGARWTFASKGTTVRAAQSAASFAAPITNVLTGRGDIGADVSITRVNAVESGNVALDQGFGNYNGAALYFGRRGGSTIPFGGIEYATLIRGAETPVGTLEQFERRLFAPRAGLTI